MNKFTIIIFIIALSCARSAYAASFDCNKAFTATEKLICTDKEINKLDEDMASSYKRKTLSTTNNIKYINEQRNWLKNTRNNCGDTNCLKSAYTKRIAEINNDISNEHEFESYPVELYAGATAKLVLDSDFTKQYRTMLSNALTNRNPIFAGEYVIAAWGCGGGCSTNSIINIRTGKVLEQTFGGECGIYIEGYKSNSRLLKANGMSFDSKINDFKYEIIYYLIENENLKVIQRIEMPKPNDPKYSCNF